jgi:Tol biopolymer transport system component/DNA-binding winged helix-turn-helix (wHTH) protein
MTVLHARHLYAFGGFRLDPGTRTLYGRDGKPIPLRAKNFDVLFYLVEHAGELVAKTDLMQAVWPRLVIEENNLNQAVSALRQCLGDDRQAPRFIATVTGRGYQFVAPVERVTEAPEGASTPGRGGPGVFGLRSSRGMRLAAAAPALAIVLLGAAAAVTWTATRVDTQTTSAAPYSARSLASAVLATDFPGRHSQPTLSPDGTMMAFVSDASGIEQIWIVNLAGGGPIRITSGERAAMFPTWSPRNDQILFQRTTDEGALGIWSIDPLGANDPHLVVDVGTTPSFGAEGERFVYAVGRTIWIANADGTGRRQIEGVPGGPGFEARRSPALSPDGRTIVFVHAAQGPGGNLWLAPVEAGAGAAARQLTGIGAGELGTLAQDPAFSPDGRFVIFSAPAGAINNTHLWRVPIEGGEPEQLTGGAGGYGRPAVARNGTRVAYSNKRSMFRLLRTDPETASHRIIHESRNPIILPTVAPDGREIAFFSASIAGTQVYTIGADGTNRRQRTFDETAANTLPVWSADGEWLYHYKDRSLYRLSRAGETSEQVIADFHWSSRHWLVAYGDRIVFRERNLEPGVRRTLLRDPRREADSQLPVTFSPTQWSRDGATILGFSQERDTLGQIYVCTATAAACRNLNDQSGPILGAEPRWSMDESRVFFRRPADRRNFSELWSADSNGGAPRKLFEFGPFDAELADSYFGVIEHDQIVWNQYDEAAAEEIWTVALAN